MATCADPQASDAKRESELSASATLGVGVEPKGVGLGAHP